jgi:HAD superfamily hydrolase (TIGR01549 family)
MQPFGDFPGFEAFFDEVFELFRHADAWDVLPGLHQTLDALREDGRKLGVISDMDARLHDVLNVLGLHDHFEIVCLSFRTGYAKPDRRLYDAAVQRANARASSCVHVGDSVAKDIEPALAAGLFAVHLADADNTTPSSAHRIHSLTELPALLERLEQD